MENRGDHRMFIVTLLIMLAQFVVIGFGIACVVFGIMEWLKEEDPTSD